MRRTSAVSAVIVFTSFAGLFLACSSSSSSTATTCSTYASTACTRACACSTDGLCRIRALSSGDAGSGKNLIFPNNDGCVQGFGNGELKCGSGGRAGVDFGTCVAAVSPGTCVDVTGGQKAIQVMDPCSAY